MITASADLLLALAASDSVRLPIVFGADAMAMSDAVLCLESRKLLVSGQGIQLLKVDEHEVATLGAILASSCLRRSLRRASMGVSFW
jgi:hypothetical protein